MGVPGLQNIAIDQLYQRRVKCTGNQANLAEFVYSSTPPTSALRRYLVDQQVYLNLLYEAKRTELSSCRDFVFDICLRLSGIRAMLTPKPNASEGWKLWMEMDMSRYHVRPSKNKRKEHSAPGKIQITRGETRVIETVDEVVTVDLSD